jgi:diguanylate cyclase (GGDEF)-like protein
MTVSTVISETAVSTAEVDVNVTISLGVAELRNEEGETFDKLLARADAALYRAKSEGRNRVCG